MERFLFGCYQRRRHSFVPVFLIPTAAPSRPALPTETVTEDTEEEQRLERSPTLPEPGRPAHLITQHVRHHWQMQSCCPYETVLFRVLQVAFEGMFVFVRIRFCPSNSSLHPWRKKWATSSATSDFYWRYEYA